MNTIKVLLCTADDGVMVQVITTVLRSAGLSPQFEVVEDKDDTAAIQEAIIDSVLVYPNKALITRDMIASARNLRLIHCGTGYDTVDLEAARDHGIHVCTTGDAMARSTAEHTLLLILALAKGLGKSHREMRAGKWIQDRGVELGGKVLGLYGFGNIGRMVAQMAHGLDMQILATRRHPDAGTSGLDYVRIVRGEELLEQADILSLHLPLVTSGRESTRGLIGEKELRHFGASGLAWLVNTARGAIVDEAALVHALQDGTIKQAALDTFPVEPLPAGHILRSLPNVLLTPHVAGETTGALTERYTRIARNLLRILHGEKPEETIVTPDQETL
ncbi:MAG: NAD(P)-dependent oxidoreductase [Puniceicoccaceae bacterium]